MSSASILFLSGALFGLLAGWGLPAEGDILLMSWGAISSSLLYYLPPESHLVVQIIGVIIVVFGIYLILKPVLEAGLFGLEGIAIFTIGFIIGLIITFIL